MFKVTNRLTAPEVVEWPNATLTYDDGRVDYYTRVNPESGLAEQVPIAATADEIRERDLAAWRRSLESAEHRLAALDPADHMPYERDRTPEQMAELRTSIEGEIARAKFEIAAREHPAASPAEPKKSHQ